jgi:hypothetical protein
MAVTAVISLKDDYPISWSEVRTRHYLFHDPHTLVTEAVRVVTLTAAIKLLEVMFSPDTGPFQTDSSIIVTDDRIASFDLGVGTLG